MEKIINTDHLRNELLCKARKKINHKTMYKAFKIRERCDAFCCHIIQAIEDIDEKNN